MRVRVSGRHGTGRFLTVLAAVVTGGLALLPASTARAAVSASSAGPAPAAGEWWFAGWEIQQQVWGFSQGAGVTVAVIDSGVQANVSDLRGAVVPGTVIGGSGNGEQDTDIKGKGHGTQMASLIAGRGGSGIARIAPRAKILPVSIGTSANAASGPSLSTLAAAINYAVSRGAKVISMSVTSQSILGMAGTSLPCSGDSDLQAAIDNAVASNVILVAAAGNNDEVDGAPVAPADCPGVVAVGGIQENRSPDKESDAQPYVAVSAPMDNLESQGRDGKVYHISGTSGAAALVAGEAALLRSRFPQMSWDEVVSRMTTEVYDPPGWPKPSAGYGFGIVNMAQALDQAKFPGEWVDPVGQDFEYQQLTATAQDAADSADAASADKVTGTEVAGRIALFISALLLIAGIVLTIVFASIRRQRRRERARASGQPAAPAGYGAQPYPQQAYPPPPYSQQPYSQQPYPRQPYSQQPYQYRPYPRQATAEDMTPRRRRGSGTAGLMSGLVTIVVAVILAAVGWAAAWSPSAPIGAVGASACVTSAASAGGSGPLSIVTPPTLCGLPKVTLSAADQWVSPSGTESTLQAFDVGHISSRASATYQTPAGASAYRQIDFVGFTGSFKPEQTLQALTLGDTATKTPPAGPHGGVTSCFESSDVMECAWATKTTAGIFWIIDSTNYLSSSLIGPKVYAANFTRIRDVLEVGG